MNQLQQQDSQSIKIDGASGLKTYPRFTTADARAYAWLQDLEQIVGFGENARLYEVNIGLRPTGWLTRVKAVRHRRPGVAFLSTNTWEKALERLATELGQGTASWKPDEYPNHRTYSFLLD